MFARSLKPLRCPEPITAFNSSSMISNAPRTLPIGTSSSSVPLPQDPKDKEGVELLLGIATIVSKEIASSDKELFDDGYGDNFKTTRDETPFAEPSIIFDGTLPSRVPPTFSSVDDGFAWHRVRTVSIDNEYWTPRRNSNSTSQSRDSTKPSLLPAVVSPVGKRLRHVRKPSLKLLAHKGKKEQIKLPKINAPPQQGQNQNLPNIMSQHKRKAAEQSSSKGKTMIFIHRKKFSWKNYPGESCREMCGRFGL